MKRQYWTKEDKEWLLNNFLVSPKEVICRHFPSRTWEQIKGFCNKKLNLKYKFWSKEEDEILLKYYKYETKERLLELLPRRTWSGINSHAITVLNLNRQCIHNDLNKCGNKVKQEKKFQTLNVDFSEISDEKHAYLLGYLAADGNVYGHHLNLCVAEQDYDFITLLKEWFNETSEIKFRKVSSVKGKGGTVNII